VNILAREQEALSRQFAGQLPLDRELSWQFVQGVPTLAQAEAVFVCDLRGEHVAGDHSIFIGEVSVMHDGGSPRPPLVFYQGKYVSVSSPA
jgi:flavin reductase (DIM6/NTAB) family NADH-FMN oxidoreductase RutF